MYWLKGMVTRVRALVHPDRVERELDEEIRFHLEQEEAKHCFAPANAST